MISAIAVAPTAVTISGVAILQSVAIATTVDKLSGEVTVAQHSEPHKYLSPGRKFNFLWGWRIIYRMRLKSLARRLMAREGRAHWEGLQRIIIDKETAESWSPKVRSALALLLTPQISVLIR